MNDNHYDSKDDKTWLSLADSNRFPQPIGYKCDLCNRDLSFASEGQILQPGVRPSTAVLPCGHHFHDYCLQQITPADQTDNPPCIHCDMHETWLQFFAWLDSTSDLGSPILVQICQNEEGKNELYILDELSLKQIQKLWCKGVWRIK